MGNIFSNQDYLDKCIIGTKQDIMTNYDLTNKNNVTLANISFCNFSKKVVD